MKLVQGCNIQKILDQNGNLFLNLNYFEVELFLEPFFKINIKTYISHRICVCLSVFLRLHCIHFGLSRVFSCKIVMLFLHIMYVFSKNHVTTK